MSLKSLSKNSIIIVKEHWQRFYNRYKYVWSWTLSTSNEVVCKNLFFWWIFLSSADGRVSACAAVTAVQTLSSWQVWADALQWGRCELLPLYGGWVWRFSPPLTPPLSPQEVWFDVGLGLRPVWTRQSGPWTPPPELYAARHWRYTHSDSFIRIQWKTDEETFSHWGVVKPEVPFFFFNQF